ncbi:MAG: hypothetical protein ABW252_06070 [Polyangiales bacterium]
MRSVGWLWTLLLLLSLSALDPGLARAAEVDIEEVWDRAEERALQVPRALLFTGSLVAATTLGSAFVGSVRARDIDECRVSPCSDPDARHQRQHRVNIATGALAAVAVVLLVSGGRLLVKRKQVRATEPTGPAPPLMFRW